MGRAKHKFDFDSEAIVTHQSCSDCGSSDALSVYPTHTRCYSCGKARPLTNEGLQEATKGVQRMAKETSLLDGAPNPGGLRSRKLTEETLKKFSYISSTFSGQPIQIAQYRDKAGTIVAQKLRFKDKSSFPWRGVTKDLRLFGSHLWSGGKKLIVTEGEIDAMSVSQMQDHKWPVVSLINGADGAKRDLTNNLDYLEKFEEIVLMFDEDAAGKTAAENAAQALGSHITVKIAHLPLNDPNELLVAGRGDEIIKSLWNAQEYRPDGIKEAMELFEEWRKVPEASSVTYPFPGMNKAGRGLRRGELVMLTAGSGIGKSAIAREIAYHLHESGEKVGMIMLEEGTKKTLDGLVGMRMNKRLEIIRQSQDEDERNSVSQEEMEATFMDLFEEGRMILDEHWGSDDFDRLLTKMRYMAINKGVGWIILDHISIAVSGMDVDDERKALDMAMTKFRSLAEATNIGIISIVHLRKPSGGEAWEEGRIPTLEDLRGSGGLGQLSDMVWGAYRDKRNEDPERRLWTGVFMIKNRFTGEDGMNAGWLRYNRDTGRLIEGEPDFPVEGGGDSFAAIDEKDMDF